MRRLTSKENWSFTSTKTHTLTRTRKDTRKNVSDNSWVPPQDSLLELIPTILCELFSAPDDYKGNNPCNNTQPIVWYHITHVRDEDVDGSWGKGPATRGGQRWQSINTTTQWCGKLILDCFSGFKQNCFVEGKRRLRFLIILGNSFHKINPQYNCLFSGRGDVSDTSWCCY